MSGQFLSDHRAGISPAFPWLPLGACLSVSAVTAFLVMPASVVRLGTPGGALWKAALLVLLVAGATAIAARLTFPAFTPCPDERIRPFTLLWGAAGALIVPLAILVKQERLLVLPAALLLGWVAARLFRQCAYELGESIPESPSPATDSLFGDGCSSPYASGLARAVAVVVALELGILSLFDGRTAFSALLLGASTFLLAITAPAKAPPELPGSSRIFWLNVGGRTVLAITLSTLVLARLPGFAPDLTLARRSLPQSSSGSGGGAYDPSLLSGAILLADPARASKLFVPTARRNAVRSARRALPETVIEFSGVYWILISPHTRPPKSAAVMRATPVSYNFTAADRTPLVMQAHQQLPTPIDPRCCSALEVVVRNADRAPGTVALKVELATADLKRANRESLGSRQVPAAEKAVLRFPMPATPAIRRFDRIVVEFELAGRRYHRSANVSIERFVLIPRTR